KIASNSDLAARKPGWIDFDAGQVLTEGFEAAEEALIDRIVAIASGAETAAEKNGEREIAFWKRGVTLGALRKNHAAAGFPVATDTGFPESSAKQIERKGPASIRT